MMNNPITSISPGFVVVHGNRLEDLGQRLTEHLKNQPLPVFTPEVILVQSNGMKHWPELALADEAALSICAATQMVLPSSYLWQVYRCMLGSAAVPLPMPFDKDNLLWRLVRLLPILAAQDAVYGPLKRYLGDTPDGRKLYQLAQQVADVLDGYQCCRADWLSDWADGQNVLGNHDGQARPALQARHLEGIRIGFIDLMVAVEGRYYVLDYKSNKLPAYSPAHLQQAILAHRYDVQYTLYLTALHRLLKVRLPGYDYDLHMGGALYLFMRGIDQAGAGLYVDRPPKALIEALDAAFSKPPTPDWQKVACALAARQRFTLITGGPGTGKTTTVVRLLALLQSDPARQHAPLRIALAAPTGKAAARLGESIASALQKLPEAMQQHIPAHAVTLHKLLQVRANRAQDSVPELVLDLVVVVVDDEASMIDLEMMARLLAAVPLSASLILLGDKDQLASVEAGAVMGQRRATADQGHYTPDTLAWVAHTTGADLSQWAGEGTDLAQQTVMLRHSHRFADDSSIGQWAKAVNAGDISAVQQLWHQAPSWQPDAPAPVTRLQPSHAQDPRLAALVQHGWQAWRQQLKQLTSTDCTDAQALAALQAFAQFQVLCAVRKGPWGVEALNQRLATSLGFAPQGWYAGRPVMVTRNDYSLKRMNGDIGLCLPRANSLRVAFPNGQGGIHWVLPSRLDAIESVFAMTVHKSQGSEFEHVCLVLPHHAAAVLTRELLYTGVTRAKARLSLVVAQAEVLERAVRARVLRMGGLINTLRAKNSI